MHIELTDHLRCPRDHAEAFLVLLPDRMDRRRVVAGHLGCPVCGWGANWDNGVPDFGGGWRSGGAPPFDADAAVAMLGISGPGGFIALGGDAGALAPALERLLPGIALVAINPPPTLVPTDATSVMTSGAWPIKTHTMRGVVLGHDASRWRDQALASTLPGLRTVGLGEPPRGDGIDLMAQAGGVWVVTHR